MKNKKIKVCYLHSDIKTPQRTEILHKLRLGVFDCLVGVNLLREGLDLPEVALVAIMDADIESFLRDKRSLVQTIGRAARNSNAHVIFYADRITGSMQSAIDETNRRRELQVAHNEAHAITPISVTREVTKSISPMQQAIALASKNKKKDTAKKEKESARLNESAAISRINELEKQMRVAGDTLDFDTAIRLREQWLLLKKEHGL